MLVARDDPLDTYLVSHPEMLLGAPVEATVFDPDNPYVLGPHLCAAAHESPLTEADLPLFGPQARAAVDGLTAAGMLRRRPHGWFWTDRRPGRATSPTSGPPAARRSSSSRTAPAGWSARSTPASAHGTAHPGAVYVHRGETWLVCVLDLDEHVAVIGRTDVDYSTSARETTEISIVAEREHRRWGDCRLCVGEVDVTHQVVSFLKRRQPSGEVMARSRSTSPSAACAPRPCGGPCRTTRSRSPAWRRRDLPGAAHAAEHCSIGLLPLFATCDRWDIGGVSTARHADTGRAHGLRARRASGRRRVRRARLPRGRGPG